MSERGPEISAKDMGKIEIKYTVGNVEKSVEQKIQDTANKIIESGILKSEKFTTEQDRKFEADKIVESIGTGFSSYEKIVDVSRGGNYTEAQKNKAQETFDILKKSVSVAMNVGGDQELQTRLFTGGINEALPDSWKYGSDGTSKFILSEEVSKTIINNPKVRDVYREIDEIRQDYDMSDPMERKLAADEIAGKRQELLSMRKEIPKDQRDEWFLAKEYLRMEVGILDGELTSSDGSADKADVVAVLGKAVEKISVAAEKMAEATEKTTRQKEVRNENKDLEKGKQPSRYEIIDEVNKETDPIELRRIARIQLDKIEDREDLSIRYRLDGQPTWVLDEITFRLDNELIDGTKKELLTVGNDFKRKNELELKLRGYDLLRKEIQARLTIFDIGKLMSDAGYKLGEKGGIQDVIGQAANIKRIMNEEVMSFCFRESKSKEIGIDIPNAWNYIQKANFNYGDLLLEIKNSGFANSYLGNEDFLNLEDSLIKDKGDGSPQKIGLFLDKDNNPERATIVEAYIISRLGENGKKAYQLANELVSATVERSVFNFNLIKADTFADVVYFKEMRDDDARKGKATGAIASRGIKSLAHGWLRYFSRGTDLTDTMGPIMAEEIKTENIKGKEDSLTYFTKVLPSYVLAIKGVLMDVDPDPKKILNLTYLQNLVSCFDKVDIPYRIIQTSNGWEKTNDKSVNVKSRCGIHNMKPLYVLGLMELFATRENLGMDISGIRKFRELLVDTDLSDTAKPFLSESQWKWILEQKIAHIGNKNLTFVETMRANDKNKSLDKVWDFFINGGKKGK